MAAILSVNFDHNEVDCKDIHGAGTEERIFVHITIFDEHGDVIGESEIPGHTKPVNGLATRVHLHPREGIPEPFVPFQVGHFHRDEEVKAEGQSFRPPLYCTLLREPNYRPR